MKHDGAIVCTGIAYISAIACMQYAGWNQAEQTRPEQSRETEMK